MPYFKKIRPVGAALFHADGRTGTHDDCNSRFAQFCERTPKYNCTYSTNISFTMYNFPRFVFVQFAPDACYSQPPQSGYCLQ
jgi:hypothetical protein